MDSRDAVSSPALFMSVAEMNNAAQQGERKIEGGMENGKVYDGIGRGNHQQPLYPF